MANFNRVIILGNLTRDPDYKQLDSGPVCRLGLASNRQFRSKQTGSMVQEVCYVDIDVWGAQAESCFQYLQKGRAVLVEGRLKFDSWQDLQGQTRNKHLIVADRVIFMPVQNSAEFSAAQQSDKETGSMKNSTDTQLEKELLDQIEQIKNRAQVQKKEAKKEQPAQQENPEQQENNEEDKEFDQAAFKDVPPFDENMPF